MKIFLLDYRTLELGRDLRYYFFPFHNIYKQKLQLNQVLTNCRIMAFEGFKVMKEYLMELPSGA